MDGDKVIVRAAASACVFRGESVLLVQRGKAPYDGFWSLPGGSVEPGETAMEAAAREVREETGIACRLDALAGIDDVMVHDSDGQLTLQYAIAVFSGRVGAETGEPSAASDARASRFVELSQIGGMGIGPRLDAIIIAAWKSEPSR
jgi:ADP-ribose pyrophosphatase YjhB (NUDIX family)